MNEQIITIDPYGAEVDRLGPANEEQRAEIRESWRTWFWGVVRQYAATAAVVVVGLALMGIGAVIGAYQPDFVRGLLP